MAQTWNIPPSGTTFANQALKEDIPNALVALRTCFSGASEPSGAPAYSPWADTSAGMLKLRNAAETDWIPIAPLAAQVAQIISMQGHGALAVAEYQIAVPQNCIVDRVVLVPDTSTSGSSLGATDWTFLLRNVTQALDLFSATVSTASALGGVGGGEMSADAPYHLTPDQNATADAFDVLRFTVGKNGSPTAVADVAIAVIFKAAG